jgi:hypothetical protein
MDVVRMKPLKAFAYQDHEAHITTHQTFMQDPMTAQMIGQNPMAQQIMASIQAHIAEHYAFMYRNKIEQQIGAPLPSVEEDEALPQELENALSRMVAQASQQLLQQNQAAAAQQQAQEQAQDPIIQMQMQELQLKGQDLQRKALKDKTDATLKAQQQEIERQRIQSQEKIAEANAMVKAVAEDEKLKFKQSESMIKAVADDEKNQLEMDKELLRLRSKS